MTWRNRTYEALGEIIADVENVRRSVVLNLADNELDRHTARVLRDIEHALHVVTRDLDRISQDLPTVD
jgi:hypothetical protein